jgi:hypothetical protein
MNALKPRPGDKANGQSIVGCKVECIFPGCANFGKSIIVTHMPPTALDQILSSKSVPQSLSGLILTQINSQLDKPRDIDICIVI